MDHFDAVVTDPRLTRNVVEAHLDALTTDAYLLDEYHVCASGGSSGRRGIFVYDRDGWATTFLSYLRFSILHMQQTLGAEVPRMAIVSADKASHMTGAMGQTFPPPGDPVPRFPATWPIARIVAGLNEHQPNVLMGYASMVLQLAKEAEAGGCASRRSSSTPRASRSCPRCGGVRRGLGRAGLQRLRLDGRSDGRLVQRRAGHAPERRPVRDRARRRRGTPSSDRHAREQGLPDEPHQPHAATHSGTS
jgi:hypothetical protein